MILLWRCWMLLLLCLVIGSVGWLLCCRCMVMCWLLWCGWLF